MSLMGWLQILIFYLAISLATRPVGKYLYRVMETDNKPLKGLIEPALEWVGSIGGQNLKKEQTWVEYGQAVLVFSMITILITYGILRLQNLLWLNPHNLPAVPADLSLNTAVSFGTNTNWQAYYGENTLSYLSQMAGLAWHNFLSASVGMGVAMACARGFTRKHSGNIQASLLKCSSGEKSGKGITTGDSTIGNFWADLMNATCYVLIPISIIAALIMVSTGVIQNFAQYKEINSLEGARQSIPMGPVASQEAIKQVGTNGGGFFNANAAHPFENPTPVSNFLSMFLIFLIPAGLTYTYGLMARNTRQGWVLFLTMSILFLMGTAASYWAETRNSPILNTLSIDGTVGNLEGKELRFGIPGSALYSVVTTDASCGAVNCMHDSLTPLGGLVTILNIHLGEIIFGGVGTGLYGILIFVVLTVFIAGLMVGRTPEYLGKKIEAREMKIVTLYILIFPVLILVPAAWSIASHYGIDSLNNSGPHGLSEILYAFSSGSGNNGSAFAGLNANTPWYNYLLSICMLFGRFWMMLPILALAGSMGSRKVVPESPGTFPTDNSTFGFLLLSVILIVGALTFLPVLSLGPILEHFLLQQGRVF